MRHGRLLARFTLAFIGFMASTPAHAQDGKFTEIDFEATAHHGAANLPTSFHVHVYADGRIVVDYMNATNTPSGRASAHIEGHLAKVQVLFLEGDLAQASFLDVPAYHSAFDHTVTLDVKGPNADHAAGNAESYPGLYELENYLTQLGWDLDKRTPDLGAAAAASVGVIASQIGAVVQAEQSAEVAKAAAALGELVRELIEREQARKNDEAARKRLVEINSEPSAPPSTTPGVTGALGKIGRE